MSQPNSAIKRATGVMCSAKKRGADRSRRPWNTPQFNPFYFQPVCRQNSWLGPAPHLNERGWGAGLPIGVIMPGKRVQFEDETWQAIEAVARGKRKGFKNSRMKPSTIFSRNISSRWG